jgi:hypothetical protein
MSSVRHLASAMVVILGLGVISTGVQAQSAAPARIRTVRIGTVDLADAARRTAVLAASTPPIAPQVERRIAAARMRSVNRRIPRLVAPETNQPARTDSVVTPVAGPEAESQIIATGPLAVVAFAGLTSLQSENANPGAGPTEPPDQGFCVGDGKVVELVNLVFAQYDTSGNLTSGPLNLNLFFNVPSTDFLTDPRCYYDSATDTFFFSVTDLGDFPTISTSSMMLLAVMGGGGSTVTNYEIDTTDDGTGGTPTHPNCPCFEDQPLLGADAHGIYLSGNEFAIDPTNPTFNGAQIYAVNKADLVALNSPAGGVVFQAPLRVGTIPLSKGFAASVQPAFSSGGVFASNNNGTEYLLSSLDFNGTRDHRIAVWAITNTCSIPPGTGLPACPGTPALTSKVLGSKPYSVPPSAQQESGDIPLGDLSGGHLERLATDDDRMQQVIFATGNLYSAVTAGHTVGGVLHSAILYFVVQPSVVNGMVKGKILSQGYVIKRGLDFFYPSVGVNNSGQAAIVFSFSGANAFPSVGYAQLPATTKTPIVINTVVSGVGADDGASGYPPFGNGVARWGDYSAAVADGSNLWIVGEYVSGTCDSAAYALDQTCGGTRGTYANWGTYIGEITP